MIRQFKYSGMVAPTDLLHQPVSAQAISTLRALSKLDLSEMTTSLGLSPFVIAPTYVTIPGGKRVPQWSPTVSSQVTTYAPGTDCNGNFTSSRFQPNNNCYNYACNIATNSFAQPGRLHGILLQSPPAGDLVVKGAVADGLILVGDGNASLASLAGKLPIVPGHLVALFISQPDPTVGWGGDYHWVRSDDASNGAWSQKDGGDQVTNFDFAGDAITDPLKANWTVNQGPMSSTSISDVVVSYEFFAWLFVPQGKADII